jgi:serine/threonine protein kinase
MSSVTWITCSQEIAVGKMIPTHPNLPVFVGWCATQSMTPMTPMVMWKRVDGYNLHEVIIMRRGMRKDKRAWKPKVQHVLSWSRQLFSALACLHKNGLMHRDVKPANIMMDGEHKMIVLVDFGLGRSFSSAESKEENVRCMTGKAGTYRFMAPEVFREGHYDAKIDVYSGTMVVFMMLFGKLPFSEIEGKTVVELVVRVNLRPDLSSCKNKELAGLLMRAWDMNPNLRPHAHEMVAELKTIQDDLVLRKKEKMYSKVACGFLSAFDSFKRVSSAFSRASSTGTVGSTGTVESSCQSSTCDDQHDQSGPISHPQARLET